MANTDPETLQDIQDAINTLVSNDNDTPTEGDDEWGTRLNLINIAIRKWGTSKDVFWEELWTTYSGGAVTISGATAYTLADLADFRFPGKYLRILVNGQTRKVRLVKASKAQNYTGHRYAYITGNQKTGFTLNLCFTPLAGDGLFGGTFAFDYYKFPYKLAAAADKAEMSDANFIVHDVAATKSLLESQNNKYSVFDGIATDSMDNMVIMNDLTDEMVENSDALNGAVLGE
jgi:hypothetical protein